MKRFIVTVLSVAVFFIGVGGVLKTASASFKSDDKALEIVKKARAAIGGDAAISNVRSMTILGKVTKTFDAENAARTENGEMEINFELPNRMNKNLKLGAGEGESNLLVDKRVDVVVVRKGDGDNQQFKVENGEGVRKIVVTKPDGTTEELKSDGREPIVIRKGNAETVGTADLNAANVDGKRVFFRTIDGVNGGGESFRTNELLRTTLALLLSAPEGVDVTYTYVGEGNVDGANCEIVAASDGNSTYKLYLDKSTNLPRMMTYQAPKPFIIKINKNEAPTPDAQVKIFERRAPEMAEFQVKFSDYRAVNGLQLPFKWTQAVGGKDDEVTEITSYEINPANIGDKFKEMPTRVFVRTKKEQ